MLGRLKALVYRPAQLDLEITESTGGVKHYRLVPGAASEGFLLEPYLSTHAQFGNFIRSKADLQALAFRIRIGEGDERLWRHLKARLYRLPELRLPAS